MAFKKGTTQAQKGKAKGPVAGKKTPPQKGLPLDELDDDLDEDDDDLDFADDSDLSGADEDLDDEELDDEELDDEELDDEEDDEEESEDEEVPASAAPGRAAVNGKRKAEDQAGPSSSKKVCLTDHIPAEQVIDYEARDLCDVKLSDFAAGVTEQDVKNLCKGAVEVRPRHVQSKLVCAFVRYPDQGKATAAVQALLGGAKLKGQPFTVQYMGARWADPATRPQQLTNVLDVRGVPKSFQDKKKLAALYPTGRVVKVFRDGYAQVCFPDADALIRAVKEPSGRTVGETPLRLALAIGIKKDEQPKRSVPKKPPPSTQRGAAAKSRARKPAGGRRPGQKGTPGTKGSPKTPQQQKGKSPGQKKGSSPQTSAKKAPPKTPAKQASPKTPAKQASPKTPGQAKGGTATPKSTKKGTPFQKKTPKGTPGKA